MAEIEHFVKADAKQHPKFAAIKDLRLNLFPRRHQVELNKHLVCTLGYAVKEVLYWKFASSPVQTDLLLLLGYYR